AGARRLASAPLHVRRARVGAAAVLRDFVRRARPRPERRAARDPSDGRSTVIGPERPGRHASRLESLVAIAALAIGASSAHAQQYSPPRLADGRPDLQGIWQVRNTAHWDLEDHAGALGIPAGRGVVVDPPDGRIPYLAE